MSCQRTASRRDFGVEALRLKSLHVLEQEVRYCLEWPYDYVCAVSEPSIQQERDLALNDGKLHLCLREISIKDTDVL
jgi:hypothetical protein